MCALGYTWRRKITPTTSVDAIPLLIVHMIIFVVTMVTITITSVKRVWLLRKWVAIFGSSILSLKAVHSGCRAKGSDWLTPNRILISNPLDLYVLPLTRGHPWWANEADACATLAQFKPTHVQVWLPYEVFCPFRARRMNIIITWDAKTLHNTCTPHWNSRLIL